MNSRLLHIPIFTPIFSQCGVNKLESEGNWQDVDSFLIVKSVSQFRKSKEKELKTITSMENQSKINAA